MTTNAVPPAPPGLGPAKTASSNGTDGKAPLSVLLVEDSAVDARLLVESLRPYIRAGTLVVQPARRLTDALTELRRFSFSCVLLDLGLPDGRGVANVEAVRAADPAATIIVMTGLDDEAAAVEALKLGAQEYIVKGTQEGEKLLKTIRHAVERNRHVGDIGAAHDKAFVEVARDPLTGLVSSHLFSDAGRRIVALARRAGWPIGLAIFRLEGLDRVREDFGSAIADELLQTAAERLSDEVPEDALVARLDERELVVLLAGAGHEPLLRTLGVRLEAIQHIGQCAVAANVRAGLAGLPADASTLEGLLLAARRRLTPVGVAKAPGTDDEGMRLDPVVAYADTMSLPVDDGTGLFFCPWADLRRQSVMGVEVRTATAPETAAEMLAYFVAACREWASWREAAGGERRLAFRLPPVMAPEVGQDPSLIDAMAQTVHQHGGRPEGVILLWRSALPMATDDLVARLVVGLRARGFSVFADQWRGDTGIGQSLARLAMVPLDGIRLADDIFLGVAAEGLAGPRRRWLTATLGAAEKMEMAVIATGIDSRETSAAARLSGLHLVQGTWVAPEVGNAGELVEAFSRVF